MEVFGGGIPREGVASYRVAQARLKSGNWLQGWGISACERESVAALKPRSKCGRRPRANAELVTLRVRLEAVGMWRAGGRRGGYAGWGVEGI